MHATLASLIVGHWRIFIFCYSRLGLIHQILTISCMAPLCMVTFPFLHTWVILQGPTYDSSYLFDFLLRTNTLSCIIFVCGLRFLFSSCFFFYKCFSRHVIASQSAMNGVFNIIPYQKPAGLEWLAAQYVTLFVPQNPQHIIYPTRGHPCLYNNFKVKLTFKVCYNLMIFLILNFIVDMPQLSTFL